MDQEKIFIFVFTLAVIVFCLTIIGFFLLAIKIALLFSPEVQFMGIEFSNALTEGLGPM